VLVGLVVVFGAATDHFISPVTFRALANQMPDALLLATGMTLVIAAGGIDLSVGSVLALSGAVGGLALAGWGWPLPLAMVAALGAGAACGLVSGWVTVRWALPSFLVTLAMLEMARGGAYLVTSSQTIYLGSAVDALNVAAPGGLRAPIVAACIAVAAGEFTLRQTVFGRQILAVGSNAEAARLAGISPERVRAATFVLSGGLAAAAALAQTARLSAADPNAGSGAELEAIAAVVIGGTSLAGGRGSVLMSALGVAVIAVLGGGLAQLGVQEPTRRLVTGGVIVGAAIIDYYRRRSGPRRS
jgi:ribose transport system permease protein